MNRVKLFVIDDQEMQHLILQRMMEFYISPVPMVQYYVDATQVIDFLRFNVKDPHVLPDLIFLDLNMPVMSGVKFLEEFSKLRSLLARNIDIYILSSSIDPSDIALKNKYDFVLGYIIKPITQIDMRKIFCERHQVLYKK